MVTIICTYAYIKTIVFSTKGQKFTQSDRRMIGWNYLTKQRRKPKIYHTKVIQTFFDHNPLLVIQFWVPSICVYTILNKLYTHATEVLVCFFFPAPQWIVMCTPICRPLTYDTRDLFFLSAFHTFSQKMRIKKEQPRDACKYIILTQILQAQSKALGMGNAGDGKRKLRSS